MKLKKGGQKLQLLNVFIFGKSVKNIFQNVSKSLYKRQGMYIRKCLTFGKVLVLCFKYVLEKCLWCIQIRKCTPTQPWIGIFLAFMDKFLKNVWHFLRVIRMAVFIFWEVFHFSWHFHFWVNFDKKKVLNYYVPFF